MRVIGGLTLAPGLYKWTSAVTIASDVVLAGAANDRWIFQITENLSMAAAQKMTLSGGGASVSEVRFRLRGRAPTSELRLPAPGPDVAVSSDRRS